MRTPKSYWIPRETLTMKTQDALGRMGIRIRSKSSWKVRYDQIQSAVEDAHLLREISNERPGLIHRVRKALPS